MLLYNLPNCIVIIVIILFPKNDHLIIAELKIKLNCLRFNPYEYGRVGESKI